MTVGDSTEAGTGRPRLLAVLFADQVDSTALLNALGDVEGDRLRRAVEPILADAVNEHGGRVVKRTGDGVMAVFESASQAIDAGVSIHKRAARANRSGGLPAPIQLRVGVSTGDVTHEGDDYHGSTVVEAARLESAAPVSGLLCTDLTRALAGNRSSGIFEQRLSVEAKGFSDPIDAWTVGWVLEAERPRHQLPGALSSRGRFEFVGRRELLEETRMAWRGALAGESTGLLLGGEPGVGKTRLARELAQEAIDDGAMVLYGRCDEGLGVPFQPFAQALNEFIDRASPGLADLGRFPGELARLRPGLHEVVQGLPAAVEADSETEQYRLFDAVLSWLETTATSQPVLLVIDDFHWAAAPTLHMLRHLLRRTSDTPLCVLGTFRSTESDPSEPFLQFLGDVRRIGRVQTIQLGGLDTAGIREMLESAHLPAGDVPPTDTSVANERLVERLLDSTAGNPFFLCEVLALIRERGADAVGQDIPSAVSDVVAQRIARLSGLGIRLLEFAAASGQVVGLDVLCVATASEREELVAAAEGALNAGLLVEEPERPIRYRLLHDLVRSTLYNSMSLGTKSRIHQDLAHAIERVHLRNLEPWLDELAYHYVRSDDPADVDRAVDCSRLAGDQANRQLAFATACDHYVAALGLVDRFGSTTTAADRARLLLSLGVAKKRAGQSGTRTLLLEAAELAAANDDSETIVQAALASTRGFFSSAGRTDEARVHLLEMALAAAPAADSIHRAKLMANLSIELTFENDEERRRDLSDESLAIAERVGDLVCLAHVVSQRIGFFWNARGLPERIELCERLQELAGQLDLSQWRYVAASSQFQMAMECGDLAIADRCIIQMEAAVEELRQPTALSYLRMREAIRSIVGGELDVGERLATECFELGQAAGQPDALIFYFSQLINLRYHQGRLGELRAIVEQEAAANPGLPALQSALALIHCETDELMAARSVFESHADRADELLHDLSWLVTVALLADVCFQLDDPVRAAQLHRLLEPFRHQCVDNATNWFGSVARFLALLEHTMGRYEEADASFREALRIHTEMPAPALAARTQLDWAKSLLNRAVPEQEHATQLLARCIPTATELGLGNVLRRAVRLGELG